MEIKKPTNAMMVHFTIDGRPVEARSGETVLKTARRYGIGIPTLCHHDAVSTYGACRLCVVEVFWNNRSKIVTSCIYTPYDHDRIETNSDRVRTVRRLVLELLIARCPEVELIQNLAREYGVENARFGKSDVENHNRCILCGLCVRVCDEVVQRHAIAYENRGQERKITAPFSSDAVECIGCGACVYICPTGALHADDADNMRTIREIKTTLPMKACSCCGQSFATVAQAHEIMQRIHEYEDLSDICPSCRANNFRHIIENVGAIPGHSLEQQELSSLPRSSGKCESQPATISGLSSSPDAFALPLQKK